MYAATPKRRALKKKFSVKTLSFFILFFLLSVFYSLGLEEGQANHKIKLFIDFYSLWKLFLRQILLNIEWGHLCFFFSLFFSQCKLFSYICQAVDLRSMFGAFTNKLLVKCSTVKSSHVVWRVGTLFSP